VRVVWCVFRFRFRFYSRLGKEEAEEARPSPPPPLTRAEAARPRRSSREIGGKRGAHGGLVGGVGARPVGEVGVEKKGGGGGGVVEVVE